MFDQKNIFITGGTGSWGNELVKQLLEKYNPKKITIYSRGEHKQVEMKRHFNNPKLRFIIGDVRDKNILELAMRGADFVFHLAALKHVPVCEENCWEAVLTNVIGTQNVIECAIKNKVAKVIDVSTDKAVDPFNLYGVTKACGEKLVVNANNNYISDVKFACIRGGNVMGTNGSVLPLFKKQILENNQITITDPNMTRYLMSTREAISLVFSAMEASNGGEIFVMRMPATTVSDIAEVMIKLFGNKDTKIQYMGTRPGEKQHEVLVSKNEAPRTKIYKDDYYVIIPQITDEKTQNSYDSFKSLELEEFTSRNARRLSKQELETLILKEDWIK